MIRSGLQLLRRAHIFREGFRDIHITGASLFPDVVVPPLGESISEGSVAEIVAKQGQQIKVDDVIAQLETDKVTIDCKSAHAGTLEQIKVNVGDVVKPGSVIAVVGEGAADTQPPQQQQKPAAPSPAAPPPPPQQPAQPSTSAQQDDEEDHAGRKPMIAFPPRVAPSGERISSLPAPEADAILEREHAQHAQQQGPGAPASAAEAPTGVKQGEPPLGPPSTAFIPLVPEEGPKQPSAGLRVSEATQYLETVPSRRGPTRAEMEAINTGGADF